MELVKGVHHIDCYAGAALFTEGRLLLVDASIEPDAKSILNYLSSHQWKPTDIATIILTHTHPDHVSGLATLKERSGAKVAAHEADADYIARKAVYPGPPGPQRHNAVPVDVRLKDGQRFEELLVIHTPGHTPGSLALLDEAHSLLVAGDSLRNEGGVGPMDDRYNIDPRQHRESLKKLTRHEFEALICGHGAPIASGASKQVKAAAARL